MKTALRNISLKDHDLLLSKPSVTSILYGFKEQFNYQSLNLKAGEIISSQFEEIIQKTRASIAPDKLVSLREQALNQGLKLSDIEALAIDLVSEESLVS